MLITRLFPFSCMTEHAEHCNKWCRVKCQRHFSVMTTDALSALLLFPSKNPPKFHAFWILYLVEQYHPHRGHRYSSSQCLLGQNKSILLNKKIFKKNYLCLLKKYFIQKYPKTWYWAKVKNKMKNEWWKAYFLTWGN